MSTRTLTTLIGLAFMMTACGGGGCGAESISVYPLGCAKAPLSAWAGLDQNVVDGDTVELKGGSYNVSPVGHKWQQLSGPTVAISNSTRPTIRFQAPSVSRTAALSFRFTIKTKSGRKSSDDVTVFVEPTSASTLCLQAPLYAAIYAWTNSGCTTNSADIAGDSRVATLYRQSEAEPNGSLQTANSLIFPVQVATESQAADVVGSVHSAGDDSREFFVFTPPSSGDYHVYLCNDPLACMRGTVSEDWYLELYDQDFNVVARTKPGVLTEQKVMLWLEAGLPYYAGIFGRNANLKYWQYNLTIIRG